MNKEIQDAIDRPIEFRTSYYFSKSWDIFGKAPWMFIGAMIVGGIMSVVLLSLSYIGVILAPIFNTLFFAGFYIVARKIHIEERVHFNDFFGAFQQHFNYILIIILTTLLTSIGFAFLVLPGIYLLVAYMLALPIALFCDADIWTSMEASRKIVTKNWFSFFVYFLLLLFFNALGALVLFVGLLITVPISFISIYVIFDDMVKPSKDDMYFQDIEVLDSDI